MGKEARRLPKDELVLQMHRPPGRQHRTVVTGSFWTSSLVRHPNYLRML